MIIFDSTHKKKSAGITFIVLLILIFLFFVLGLTYYDPPIDYGMEVNFGSTIQRTGKIKEQKQKSIKFDGVEKDQNLVKSSNKTNSEINSYMESEHILTEKKSSVSLPQKENSKNQNKNLKKVKEEKKLLTKKETPKVSKTTKNIVSNLLKKNNTSSNIGEELSNKNNESLNLNGYSSTYYNNSISGTYAKGYGLNGRSLQSKGKVLQECNEQGLVVVRISVDRQGDVVLAEPGVKGTTNTHQCLLEPAKKTAQLHKWLPDNEAPEIQIGFVVIQFKLAE
tara:strand:- start:5957 stop:6796 length:840 start_codon:yes stop_codon:yes gene_type:complete